MDEKEKLRLEKIYSKMPDDELEKMLLCDRSEYKEGVYDLVSAEAKKRGFDETKFNEMKETKKSELPFSWGKFVIVMSFIWGSTSLIAVIFDVGIKHLSTRITLIIIGFYTLFYAYGLMKRMRWALNMLMFMLYISILMCISMLIIGIFYGFQWFFITTSIGGGIIVVLTIIYFRKRKYMFVPSGLSQTSTSSDVSYDSVINEKSNINSKENKVDNLALNDRNLKQKKDKEKSYEPSGYGQKLRELKKLKDEGLLTDEEYEHKRKAIVDGM